MKKVEGWFSSKSYQHFDLPWNFSRAKKYVSEEGNIGTHSFMPFLSFDIEYRRFDGKKKIRPIRFAGHRDNYIYAFYAHNLNTLYEQALKNRELGDCILAYRARIGNNITFAQEAFAKVKSLGPCVAIGLDIKGFFDNLDHGLLKQRWCELTTQDRLSKAEFAVFKSITRYAIIDRQECYKRLKYNQLQRSKCRPLCPPIEFRRIIKARGTDEPSLVQTNLDAHGIPQGSAISATLANIYMLKFDAEMKLFVDHIGGFYRRYSDDLLFIVPSEFEQTTKLFAEQEIGKVKLELAQNKTVVSHFNNDANGILTLMPGSKPLQYLGFLFDGKDILLRSQTISRYWQKTYKAINTARKDAQKASRKGRSDKIFRRQILKRYTHIGNANFLSYVKKAATDIYGSEYKKSRLWKQTKNHYAKISNLLELPQSEKKAIGNKADSHSQEL